MLSPSPPTMRFMGGEVQSMTRPTVPTKHTQRHLAPREISVELKIQNGRLKMTSF